jgi:hypothetical protein
MWNMINKSILLGIQELKIGLNSIIGDIEKLDVTIELDEKSYIKLYNSLSPDFVLTYPEFFVYSGVYVKNADFTTKKKK